MADFETTIPRAIAYLDCHPDGCDTAEMAQALQVSYTHAGGTMCTAVERGLIRWVHAPFGKAHNRRVYFAIKHCPERWGEASRKPPQGRPGKGVSASIRQWSAKGGRLAKTTVTKAQERAGFASHDRVAPPTVYGPSTTDTRYTVDKPEPFFSAMRPGNYLQSGSAIERAYGGEA